jgi:predicted RNase H-like HicB family nuclease
VTRRKVQMRYHFEPEGWWAESPQLPGFSAAGTTFDEVRELAHEGAGFFTDEPLEIQDVAPSIELTRTSRTTSAVALQVALRVNDVPAAHGAAANLVPRSRRHLAPVAAAKPQLHMR